MASLREDALKHHGCLICAGTSRATYCGLCATSRFFQEGWTAVGIAAQQRAEVLSRLDAQLAAKAALEQQQLEQSRRLKSLREASLRASAAEQQLKAVQAQANSLEQATQRRAEGLHAALEELAAQRTSVLAHQLPDTLRSRQMHYFHALDWLVKEQRLRLRGLLEVLPLKLVRTRRGPSASMSASHDGDAEVPARAHVTICSLRLPDRPDVVPATQQEAQEFGTALGYLVRFLDLLASYQGAPLLHQTDYQGSTPSIWMGRSFWDHGPGRALHRLHLSPEQAASFPGSAAPPAQLSGLQRTTSALSTLSSHAAMLWNGEAPPGRGQADSDLLRGLHLLHRSVATCVASKMGPSITSLSEDLSPIAALAGLVASLLRGKGSSKQSDLPPGHMFMSASLSDIMAFSGQGFLMEASAMLNGGSDADNVDEWDFIQLPAAWQVGQSSDSRLEKLQYLPPPPSEPDSVEHWARAMYDHSSPRQLGDALHAAADRLRAFRTTN